MMHKYVKLNKLYMRYKKVLIYKRCTFPDSYKSLKKLCLK